MAVTTTKLDNQTIRTLTELVRMNIDSSDGLRGVAEHLENEELAEFFLDCAANREEFAIELEDVLMRAGEAVDHEGTMLGRLHRWWIDARALIQNNNEHALLAEAARGEDSVKARYEEAINSITDAGVLDLVHAQYRWVRSIHDRVHIMRDSRA